MGAADWLTYRLWSLVQPQWPCPARDLCVYLYTPQASTQDQDCRVSSLHSICKQKLGADRRGPATECWPSLYPLSLPAYGDMLHRIGS